MDKLFELTNSLKKEEQQLFRKFHTRKSRQEERKDIALYDVLCSSGKYEVKNFIVEQYGELNNLTSKAHRMLRLRIKESLEDFVHQQVRRDDTPSFINKLINIARFLYFRKKYPLAWDYLKKAEKIAARAEEYVLLNLIYQYMLEYSWTQASIDLKKLIKKEKENQIEASAARSLNLAFSVIQNNLSKHYNEGKKPNIVKIIQKTLEKFDVQETYGHKASHYYKLAMLVKMSLDERYKYKELYEYFIDTLRKMEDARLFDKYNYQYKVELLNVVCYAAVRAGDYATAQKYIAIVEEENRQYPDTDFLSIKSFMAKVVCLGSTGKTEEAIEVLEYLKKKYKKLYRDDDYFFTTLNYNLSAAYLQLRNVQIPRKCLNELLNNSKRVARHSGLEMVFYCHAIESMLALEVGEYNYVTYRIAAIERKFRNYLRQAHNYRNAEFIKLLKSLASAGIEWESDIFKKKALQFIAIKPRYTPGPEFISFNAWLYSKMENVSYNETEYNNIFAGNPPAAVEELA